MKREKEQLIGVEEHALKTEPAKIPIISAVAPEEPRRAFHPKINLQICTNSFNCIVYCPHDAIRKNEKGRPQINYDICTGCLICLRECPTNAISEEKEVK